MLDRNKLKNCLPYSYLLKAVTVAAFMLIFSIDVFAVNTYSSDTTAYSINFSFIYGLVSFASFVLAVGYIFFVKKREKSMVFLFLSVFIVNTGYLLISVSKTLETALWANRFSYLGSVFLPLCMIASIAKVCNIEISRSFKLIGSVISSAVFFLAASGGWLELYYKQVSLVTENGVSRLEKVYGDFHVVYLVYLVSCFLIMSAFIVSSILKKKIRSYKYSAMLISVVLLNILIWFLEQIIHTDYEMLSVSYIVSELLLLGIYGMMNEHNELHKNLELISEQMNKKQDLPVQTKLTDVDNIDDALNRLELREKLTEREKEVLVLLTSGYKRKAIADELCVSENTVKTHLSHIFAKTGVSSKKELMVKLFSDKE